MQIGSYKVWEIVKEVCPLLEFDEVPLNNCLWYYFYIYGAFDFLFNFIVNL